MARRSTPYRWNGKAARYRNPDTGRFISRDDVRLVLDGIIDKSRARVLEASVDLRAGTIDVGEWDRRMRLEIKRTHLASEALLRGGWNQMTPADYGRVGQAVRVQYDYLERFVGDLRAGRIRADGTFFNRAQLYPASARVAFHEGQATQLEALGYTQERNVLHKAEHCAGCVDMTALGWVALRTLVPIGARQCLGNDRCSIRYR